MGLLLRYFNWIKLWSMWIYANIVYFYLFNFNYILLSLMNLSVCVEAHIIVLLKQI